jgi:hypothetical protein
LDYQQKKPLKYYILPPEKKRRLPVEDNLTALFHLCFNRVAFKNGPASQKGRGGSVSCENVRTTNLPLNERKVFLWGVRTCTKNF